MLRDVRDLAKELKLIACEWVGRSDRVGDYILPVSLLATYNFTIESLAIVNFLVVCLLA
jgi:hypothetical protein